jgi:hypothetical protein
MALENGNGGDEEKAPGGINCMIPAQNGDNEAGMMIGTLTVEVQ